jgi:hypothetical protein
MVYSGAWGKLIHEKPEVENLMTLSLLTQQSIHYSEISYERLLREVQSSLSSLCSPTLIEISIEN